jgi:hypothetical protein
MGASKREDAVVATAEDSNPRPHTTAVANQVVHLGPKGLTFATDQYVPEWTEVGVEMRLPSNGPRKDQQIDCRGVVVQCARRQAGRGFEVSLLFLDLPKKAHPHLNGHATPLHVSISR